MRTTMANLFSSKKFLVLAGYLLFAGGAVLTGNAEIIALVKREFAGLVGAYLIGQGLADTARAKTVKK